MKDELSDALKPGVSSSEIEKLARKKKMVSMRQDAMEKIEAGVTSVEEVDRVLGVF
jgi:type II secretory ATPase GspE/PulE/Tfp pilus assembly ATPase PilB-like protein